MPSATDGLKTQYNTDDHNGDKNIGFDVISDNGNKTLLPATTRKRSFRECSLEKVKQSTTKEANQQQIVVAEEINNDLF